MEERKGRVSYVIGPDGSPLTLADLPPPSTRRWVIRRKAEVVAAVRGGLLSLDDACKRYTLTVEEYRGRSRLGRLWYRCYRSAPVMFVIGPAYMFLLQHRLPLHQMRQGWRPWVSTMATNLAIAAMVAGLAGERLLGPTPLVASTR